MIPGTQSLHSHTFNSDGLFTYQSLLDTVLQYGISTVAFTDHDYLPDEKTVKELKHLNHPVKWLIGIELSAGLPKELGGGVDGPHMLGLFVDPANKKLLEHCKKSQEERITRMKIVVKNLKSLGFDITKEDCLKEAKGGSVVQPHIVAALKSKRRNLKLIDEYVLKMKKTGESDPKWAQRYRLMMQQGEKQYPYMLFLGDNAFVPGVKVPYRYWVDFDTSVSLIRNAGGVAIIAHYATVNKTIGLKMIGNLLRDDRLDGMETVYGFWKYGTDEEGDIKQERKKVKKLVERYDKIKAGGADIHSEEDIKNFASSDWYSKNTVGMAEEIIKKKKVDLSWSTF